MKVKKILFLLLKSYIYITSFIATIFIIYGIYSEVKTGKSYCIIMNSEKDYQGEYMKSCIKPEKTFYGNTKQCILWDNKYDNGNGKYQGKIRWSECTKIYDKKTKCKKISDY